MSKSLKSNYIFNLINTVSQILFPLITFPYASRIMLPEGIGHVNFYTSIISYITLFSSLGIPVYAIKAAAAVRNDLRKLNTVTLEIVSLNLILTIIAYFAVAIISITIPKVADDIPLFLVLSLSIVFTTIGCEWFYKGIEDFKYITIRGLVVKALSVIMLFVFVKTKDDVLIYGLYTVIGSIGGNIFNFIRLRKYISIKGVFKDIHPFKHLKPVLHVFLFSAITSIYLQLNTVILGFMKPSSDVGIYTAALRLFAIVNGVIGSLSGVMLPRISNLAAKENIDEIKRLGQKAYDFSFAFSLPCIIGLIACGPNIIHLLCGDSFLESGTCIQIMAPIMLFLSISSLLGYQILYPLGHLNIVIGYCIVGSVLCVIFDIILISDLSYIGVSISYLATEMTVAIIAMVVSRRFIKIEYFSNTQKNAFISTIILSVVFWAISSIYIEYDIIQILLFVIIGASVYSASMFVLKDSFYIDCIRSIKTLIKR